MLSLGKSTISMAMFNSYVTNYQRVSKAFKNSERYFLGKLYHNNYHSYGIDGIAMEMGHIYFDGFPLRFFDLKIGALPMAKERRFSSHV